MAVCAYNGGLGLDEGARGRGHGQQGALNTDLACLSTDRSVRGAVGWFRLVSLIIPVYVDR